MFPEILSFSPPEILQKEAKADLASARLVFPTLANLIESVYRNNVGWRCTIINGLGIMAGEEYIQKRLLGEPAIPPEYWDPASAYVKKHATRMFENFRPLWLDLVRNVRPFVITPDVAENLLVGVNLSPGWPGLTLPFDSVSFEYLGKRALASKWHRAVTHDDDGKSRAPLFDVLCVAAREITPESYFIVSLSHSHVTSNIYVACTILTPENEIEFRSIQANMAGTVHYGCGFDVLPSVLSMCLGRVQSSKLGIENANIRVVLGKKRHATTHKINQIVRVVPGKDYQKTTQISGSNIDWSHRWEVRGHWRRVRGIGKDRGGIYQMGGWTWVVPCVKGPPDLPLVKKSRLVLGNDSSATPPMSVFAHEEVRC